MKRKNLHIIFIILLSIFWFNANTQTRQELEEKRKKTLKEIEYTNQLIQKTKLEKKISLNQLLILNKKIKAREELIASISKDIAYLEERILLLSKKLDSLEVDLKRLKNSYNKMILFAYKTRSIYDKIVFIISAEDFNKAYRRLKYLQYYSEYRQKQIRKIISTKNEIQSIINQLIEKKKLKEELKNESEREKLELSKDKEEQAKVLNSLKVREKDLYKKLNEQKQADKKLQESIKALIAEEIRKAKEEAERRAREAKKEKEKAKTSKPVNKTPTEIKETKETEILLTPEEQLINNQFEANRGRLPWPTERGIILSSYGEHDHPVLKGVKIRNDGVYISTLPNATVRSIFDGEVSKVLSIPGKNKVIIIKHGNFFSVYANLKEVFVSVGQKVKVKQSIGIASTDEEEGKTFIELQIWQGNVKLNPEFWLSR